jgi:hypothetical protein
MVEQQRRGAYLNGYEEFLKRALAEGWRDPIRVTDLEIKAYQAGVLTERKRVMLILSKAAEGSPMRIIDLLREIDKIKKPNQ